MQLNIKDESWSKLFFVKSSNNSHATCKLVYFGGEHSGKKHEEKVVGNLQRHLERWHNNIIPDMKECIKNGGNVHQKVAEILKQNSEKAKEQARKLGVVAVANLNKDIKVRKALAFLCWATEKAIPLLATESIHWDQFLFECKTGGIPNRKCLRKFLDIVFDVIVEEKKATLQKCTSVSISFDGWDRDGEKLIGVLAHYLDPNWQQRTMLLGLLLGICKLSSPYLCSSVQEKVNEFIPGDKTLICAVVSDNTNSVKKAGNTASII